VQKQTDVLVVCPDCGKVYVQRVTGEYIGPRKRAPNYKPALQERCKAHGQTFEQGFWYGLMRCTECSVRRHRPSSRRRCGSGCKKGNAHADVRADAGTGPDCAIGESVRPSVRIPGAD
jgi:hypothetical protein